MSLCPGTELIAGLLRGAMARSSTKLCAIREREGSLTFDIRDQEGVLRKYEVTIKELKDEPSAAPAGSV